MEFNIRSAPVAEVIELSGRITGSEATDLTHRLEEHLASGVVRALVLDLSEVDYMSSAGLGTVVWLAKRMREGKQSFALAGLRDRVAQVFRLSGLDRILPIYLNLAEAEAAIEQGGAGAIAIGGRKS